MMSGIETVKVRKQPLKNGRWRAKYQRELLERAAADGLTQEAIEALRTNEGWGRWLEVRSHLATHGLHNQFLVAHQRPGARRVATSRGWLSLGYEVRSGEKPIRVWAYVPASKSAIREWKEAGSPPEQQPEGELRLVGVFDQDQVSPLAQSPDSSENGLAAQSSDAHRLIWSLGQLIKFASEIGAPVNFEPIASEVRGYHEPGTGAIVIDASPDFPPAAQADRLIYELANVLIDEDPRRDGLKLCDGESGLVARSVAYCVCSCAGSTAYREPIAPPAEWTADSAVLPVRYAALIDRVAGRLEAALRSGLDREPE
jgi:hypothetical protein